MSELQDVLERFRRGAELLAMATTGAAGTELDFKPGEGKWGVRQIVCHLADAELVLAFRMRMVIAEENPPLTAFDQNLWADKLDYSKRKISQVLESFRRMRTENYELVKDLPEEAFGRSGQHSEKGPVTLRNMVETYAGHVESHVRQLQGVRAAYKEFRAASPRPA